MADDIYQRVRSDILGGRLEVGRRLKLAAMAADYDVSLNIVREALSRLASDRLVKTQPQLGFAVASMTASELQDLTFVRVSIECLALKRSIELGGVDWEAGLLAAHHRLANTPIQMAKVHELRSKAYADTHAAFHVALVSACDSPMLLEMCQSLHDAAELYRRLAYRKQRVHKDPDREHKRLVDAALSRDVERATSLLAKHYEETTRVCLEAGFCLPESPDTD